MKKLIFTLLIFSIFSLRAFSQETNAVSKKKGLLPPYFSVFYRAEGLSYFRTSGYVKSYNDFINTAGISANIGRKLFFTVEMGGVASSKEDIIGLNYGAGLGYYILDKRNETGRGSSLKISLMYSYKNLLDKRLENKIDSSDELLNSITYYSDTSMITHGALLLINYDYNFYKNFALRVGFNLSGSGVTIGNKDSFSGEGESKGGMFSYGLSIGLAF